MEDRQRPQPLDERCVCQRWRAGRDTYRPAGEPIDQSRYGVEVLSESEAKQFCVSNHYSKSYPAARCRVGMYETQRGGVPALVGVAVFSVPMNNAAIPKYTGVTAPQGVELGRFVLLDHVPANGETWFLSRAFAALEQTLPGVRAVLSYSDPVPLVLADGTLRRRGHLGTIYQAGNARYCARGAARTLFFATDGTVLAPRALSKIRNDEQGAGYAVRQLEALGAPRRQHHESGRAYVERALREGGFRSVKHPGNHVYVWAIGKPAERRETRRGFVRAQPYPKQLDTPIHLAA